MKQEQVCYGCFYDSQHDDNLGFERSYRNYRDIEEEMFPPFEEFGDNPNELFSKTPL